jgi:hypothetical protein
MRRIATACLFGAIACGVAIQAPKGSSGHPAVDRIARTVGNAGSQVWRLRNGCGDATGGTEEARSAFCPLRPTPHGQGPQQQESQRQDSQRRGSRDRLPYQQDADGSGPAGAAGQRPLHGTRGGLGGAAGGVDGPRLVVGSCLLMAGATGVAFASSRGRRGTAAVSSRWTAAGPSRRPRPPGCGSRRGAPSSAPPCPRSPRTSRPADGSAPQS